MAKGGQVYGMSSSPEYIDSVDSVINRPDRMYVVLAPLTLPIDMFGAHSATFIVPRGVERPRGDPSHSAVIDLND